MRRIEGKYSAIKRSGSPCWYYKTESMANDKSSELLVKDVRKLDAEAWARLTMARRISCELNLANGSFTGLHFSSLMDAQSCLALKKRVDT